MKALTCTQCGGTINPASMKCEYCGTSYRMDEGLPRIIVHRPGVQVLQGEARVSRDFIKYAGIDDKEIGHMVRSDIARGMAEELTNFMDVQTRYDPMTDSTVVRGRVRVIPSDYTF